MRFSDLRVQWLPRARPGGAPCMKYALTFAIFLAATVAAILSADWVSAHGSGFQLTKQAQAGPYKLLLGTIPDPPIVGEAILILQVADPDTGDRVQNVIVRAAPVGPDGPGVPLAFGPDSYDPTLYEARAFLENEGPWEVTITVSGEDGSGSALFTYDVKRASPIAGLITLATLLAFVTILGLSMRAFLKQRASGQSGRLRRA